MNNRRAIADNVAFAHAMINASYAPYDGCSETAKRLCTILDEALRWGSCPAAMDGPPGEFDRSIWTSLSAVQLPAQPPGRDDDGWGSDSAGSDDDSSSSNGGGGRGRRAARRTFDLVAARAEFGDQTCPDGVNCRFLQNGNNRCKYGRGPGH